jgi:hypothetical protein
VEAVKFDSDLLCPSNIAEDLSASHADASLAVQAIGGSKMVPTSYHCLLNLIVMRWLTHFVPPFQIISHFNFFKSNHFIFNYKIIKRISKIYSTKYIYYENTFNEETNCTYLVSWMSILYCINLVKLEMLWLFKKVVMACNLERIEYMQPVRSAYQPPVSSTFLSE